MNNSTIKSYRAGAAIAPYTIVKFGASSSEVVTSTSPDDLHIGVTGELGAAQGERIDVRMGEIGDVRFGGAVGRGQPITADALGRATAAAPGNRTIGMAMIDANAGDVGACTILAGSNGTAPVAAAYATSDIPRWSKTLADARAGLLATPARIAFVGDSKTRGAGAGSANSSGQALSGAAMKARPYRVGEIMRAAGIPVALNTWFGAGGAGTIPDVVAYDPRLSGFTNWGGGGAVLGGGHLVCNVNDPGQMTPNTPVNRVSLFYRDSPGRPDMTITKGADPVVTIVPPKNAAGSLIRAEAVFATRDMSPVVLARAAGAASAMQIAGLVCWDSTAPGIEIANLGVFGVTSAYQAGTADATAPLLALGVYAPHLTVINLGTNDLTTGVARATWIANITAIVRQAKISGDVILCWPAVAGVSPSGGSDGDRAVWRAALKQLATDEGCLFVDEEALTGGRAATQSGGWFADSVHENGSAYYRQAAALARVIINA